MTVKEFIGVLRTYNQELEVMFLSGDDALSPEAAEFSMLESLDGGPDMLMMDLAFGIESFQEPDMDVSDREHRNRIPAGCK